MDHINSVIIEGKLLEIKGTNPCEIIIETKEMFKKTKYKFFLQTALNIDSYTMKHVNPGDTIRAVGKLRQVQNDDNINFTVIVEYLEIKEAPCDEEWLSLRWHFD